MPDEIRADYPVWLKAISWVGVPALTLVGVWLVARPVWEPAVSGAQYWVGAGLGALVLYQCAIGAQALRYMNVTIVASNDGLLLVSRDGERLVPWENIGPLVEYSFATTTRLSDHHGQTLLFAFDNMRNFNLIKAIIRGLFEPAA